MSGSNLNIHVFCPLFHEKFNKRGAVYNHMSTSYVQHFVKVDKLFINTYMYMYMTLAWVYALFI